jgi:hypothetical protein
MVSAVTRAKGAEPTFFVRRCRANRLDGDPDHRSLKFAEFLKEAATAVLSGVLQLRDSVTVER